jgi:hypothetical protein
VTILGGRFVAISGLNLLSAGRSDAKSFSRHRIGRCSAASLSVAELFSDFKRLVQMFDQAAEQQTSS